MIAPSGDVLLRPSLLLFGLGAAVSASPLPVRVPVRFEPWGPASARATIPGGRVVVDASGLSVEGPGGGAHVTFVDGDPRASVDLLHPLPGVSSYLIGDDPRCWRTDVAGFSAVRVRDVHPGIDVVVHVAGSHLEYDIVVWPGADPDRFRIRVEGDDCGRVLAPIVPECYQDERHRRATRPVRIVADASGAFRFDVEGRDPALPLVIDPILAYGSYLGGTERDEATGVAVDVWGNVYVAGTTWSLDFPVISPLQGTSADGWDGFVAKLTPDGSQLVYATYLGGSSIDTLTGIAVDTSGAASVVGHTSSQDFPTVAPFQGSLGGQNDAIVARLDPSGRSLAWSTYLGGWTGDYGLGIAVGPADAVFVVGMTYSPNFPTEQPLQPVRAGYLDGFVTKLSWFGTVEYSTYLGGRDDDWATAVAVDGNGRACVAGITASDDFPTVSPVQANRGGAQDAFVAVLSSTGSRIDFSTFLGGSLFDGAAAIAVDGTGSLVLAGSTTSTDLPVPSAFQPLPGGGSDAFVCRIDPVAARLSFSSYLGGSEREQALGVAVDRSGGAHVVGSTWSTDFPAVDPMQPRDGAGAFVARVDPGPVLTHATWLGGEGADGATAVAATATGDAWVVGTTASSDFPTASPLQPQLGGWLDAFLARVDTAPSPVDAEFRAPARVGTPPLTVEFEDRSTGAVTGRLWSFGDGATSADVDPSHVYTAVGDHTVTLAVSGPNGSDVEAKPAFVRLAIADFTASPTDGLAPLPVAFSNLTQGNVSSWEWDFGDGATSTAQSPTHTYTRAGDFSVRLTAFLPPSQVQRWRYAYVRVREVAPDFAGAPRIGRPPTTVQFTNLTAGVATGYTWTFGDGATSTAASPSHTYAATGRYTVSLAARSATTTEIETKVDFVLVSQLPPANVATGPGPDPAAPPLGRAFDVLGQPHAPTSFLAYAVNRYGLEVGLGGLDGAGPDEILTGPGPGAVFGPQVRAFRPDSTSLPKVNFYAYGTLRYGVAPAGAALDGDAAHEVLTGPGPGAVFGPHVRGFDDPGSGVAPLPGLSFFAYGTLKYGVVVAGGHVASDGRDEILTGPGPGPTFAPVVRGFRYGPPASAIAALSFAAFAGTTHGARPGSGNLDADVHDEILACPGPGPGNAPLVRGFQYDGTALAAIAGIDFQAWPVGLYGAEAHGGDLDGDGAGEVLAARGADPAYPAEARGFDYTGVTTPLPALGFVAYPTRYGLHVAVGDLGF